MLAREIRALCSPFENRVETIGVATASLDLKRLAALLLNARPDARVQDVKKPSEGVE